MNHSIRIENLKKSFDESSIFDDLNLEIESGKITVLFGPNGCGKSTLLNILAGVAQQDSGNVRIENFNHHKFSYIFQNYRESLLPWRNNFDNIAFPLEIQKYKPKAIEEKIDELQNYFELPFELDKYPRELSGGQQQVLAFSRALITNPEILFIDEPFSALDYENNIRLRENLQEYYLKTRPTIVLISHNIEEAVHLADKIIVLSKKPTTVIEVIENPLPYPRTLESLKSDKFHHVKDQVLSAFQKATNL